MATAFRTVSEEVSWTDWSAPEDRPVISERPEGRRFNARHALALLVGAALLMGVFYLVPAGSY